jgi:SAM-dependent methyltransferase
MLESHLPASARRILDVGSGPGFFLKCGTERGWTAVGVEPSRQAAAHARSLGLEIVEEFLSESNVDSLGQFDVVHMHEVLEHIGDPRQMLGLAHRLLKPGGILCVIVPNDYNPFMDALRKGGFEPWWVAPPHHVNYFDVASLRDFVASVGFAPVHVTSTFPIEMFLLMGDNYIGDDEVGRRAHKRRMAMEHALAGGGGAKLKSDWYAAMAKLGLGREAVVYARRGDAR